VTLVAGLGLTLGVGFFVSAFCMGIFKSIID
jgi:hypothetical protein